MPLRLHWSIRPLYLTTKYVHRSRYPSVHLTAYPTTKMAWWPFSTSGGDSGPSAPVPPQTPSSPLASGPHNADFYAAHPHLAPPAPPLHSTAASSTPSASTSTPSDPPTAANNEELDPSFPRRMSCRAAFDSAFYCASLGGHFNDLYRYGQLRSCSEHWSDFWFCMRTNNSYNGRDVKERMVYDRYHEKEIKLMSGPNSEEVWVRRKPGEQVLGAFTAGTGIEGEEQRR